MIGRLRNSTARMKNRDVKGKSEMMKLKELRKKTVRKSNYDENRWADKYPIRWFSMTCRSRDISKTKSFIRK